MSYRYPPANQIGAQSKSREVVDPNCYIRGEVALPGELYSVAEQGLRESECGREPRKSERGELEGLGGTRNVGRGLRRELRETG